MSESPSIRTLFDLDRHVNSSSPSLRLFVIHTFASFIEYLATGSDDNNKGDSPTVNVAILRMLDFFVSSRCEARWRPLVAGQFERMARLLGSLALEGEQIANRLNAAWDSDISSRVSTIR